MVISNGSSTAAPPGSVASPPETFAQRYRAIFDQHFQHVFLVSPAGRVLEINDLPLEAEGLTREQVVGQLAWETVWWRGVPEARGWWLSLLDEATKARVPVRRAIPRKPTDGAGPREVECTATVVRNEDGTPDCYVIQGAAEERRVNNLLEGDGRRLNAIVNASPVAKMLSSADQKVTFMNRAFVQTFGYTLGEVRTLTDWWRLAVPEPGERTAVVDAWRLLLQKARGRDPVLQPLECRVRCKSGAIKTVLATSVALDQTEAGDVLMVLYDITERKAAEDGLRRSETLLRLAGHAAQLGGWSLDLRDQSITWSEQACAIHEMPPGTTPTVAQVVDLYLPQYREQFMAAVAACIRTGTPFDLECEGVTAKGNHLWVRSIARAVRDQSGRVLHIQGAVQDITERKRADLELVRSNRALNMLSRCSEAVMHAKDEDSMLQSVCQTAVDTGGYKIARIGYAVSDRAHSIKVMAHAGAAPPFLDGLQSSWSEHLPEGLGPLGVSMRTGEVVHVEDLSLVPRLSPLAGQIREAKLGTSVFLPLDGGKGTFGVVAMSAPEGVRVSEHETGLLRKLADQVAFGVAGLRARTERDEADSALRASLQEKESLLKEVHHRVKNNLQLVTSLLRLESNRIENPDTRTVLKGMQNRIQSMALLHEAIYRSGSFGRVDLGAYLRQVASHVSRSLVTGSQPIEFRLDLCTIEVDVDQAIPCGLILNEIVTNALKHAFPDRRSGNVWIDLHELGEGNLRLRIRDDGVGLPGDFDIRRTKSLGLQVVSDLARQLRATLEIGSGPGASFQISFAPKPAAFQPRA